MVAHGVSRGERVAAIKAPAGATEVQLFFRRYAARFHPPLQPTARAVGYLLALLRSFWRALKRWFAPATGTTAVLIEAERPPPRQKRTYD